MIVETAIVSGQASARNHQQPGKAWKDRGLWSGWQSGVSEVDDPVLREVAIGQDLEQPLRTAGVELGQSANRLG